MMRALNVTPASLPFLAGSRLDCRVSTMLCVVGRNGDACKLACSLSPRFFQNVDT